MLVIVRPHRSTTYVDVTYCYRPSSMVCWLVWQPVCRSVTLVSPAKMAEKNRDAIWVQDSAAPRDPCIRWEYRSPMGRGNFQGGKGCPTVKYRDTLRSSVQEWLNRSRCRLGCGLGWAQGIMW